LVARRYHVLVNGEAGSVGETDQQRADITAAFAELGIVAGSAKTSESGVVGARSAPRQWRSCARCDDCPFIVYDWWLLQPTRGG
jgi:hypothetical protein